MLDKLFNLFKKKEKLPTVIELKKAYCVGCKEHTLISNFTYRVIEIPPKGIRNQIKGTCTTCNGSVTTFVKLQAPENRMLTTK
tara:strand:- start:1289 stop:1537 length:249 start_codon:yes stop_codon:yes gene_type:complete